MENTVFDILVYVFDRYMLEELPADTERETIERDLARVGFGEDKVTRALDWLADLADYRHGGELPANARAFRVYSSYELRRLDAAARGLLLALENGGVLSSAQRELVIDRLLALETEELSLEQVKWVVMMVLSSQPAVDGATVHTDAQLLSSLQAPHVAVPH
jgi:Smg protein